MLAKEKTNNTSSIHHKFINIRNQQLQNVDDIIHPSYAISERTWISIQDSIEWKYLILITLIKVTWYTMKLLNWIWRVNAMFEVNRWMPIHPTYSPTSSHVDLLSLHRLNKWKWEFLIILSIHFNWKKVLNQLKTRTIAEARWWLQKFKAWSACIPRKLFFLKTNNKKIDTTTWKLKLKAKKKKIKW